MESTGRSSSTLGDCSKRTLETLADIWSLGWGGGFVRLSGLLYSQKSEQSG